MRINVLTVKILQPLITRTDLYPQLNGPPNPPEVGLIYFTTIPLRDNLENKYYSEGKK